MFQKTWRMVYPVINWSLGPDTLRRMIHTEREEGLDWGRMFQSRANDIPTEWSMDNASMTTILTFFFLLLDATST